MASRHPDDEASNEMLTGDEMKKDSPTDDQPDKEAPTDERPAEDERSTGAVSRRSALRLAGAAATAGVATSVASREASAAVDTVYDAVDDLGMDPNGNSSIDAALDDAYGDGVRIEFPPGEYLVTESHGIPSGANGFEMVGLGSSHRDVKFVFPEGYDKQWFNIRSGSDHVFRNFSIDQTDDSVTGVMTTILNSDGLVIEDVEQMGFSPDDEKYNGAGYDFGILITDPDGVGVVRNLIDVGGGIIKDYPYRRAAIYSGPGHEGELRIENAHIENCGSAPVYATRHDGCVRVEGGVYKNNDHQQIRVAGGHSSKRSWIKDARVVIDFQNIPDDMVRDPLTGIRGIWIESARYYNDDMLVENVDMEVRSLAGDQTLPACIEVDDNHGSADIVNCRVYNEIGCPAVRAVPPSSEVDGPERILVDGCSFTGSYGEIDLHDRDDSAVTGACLQLSDCDGVVLHDCSNVGVSDSNINVSGEAIVTDNSTVSTSNITYSDSCPAPGDGSGGDDGSDDGGSSLAHTIELVGTGVTTNYEFTTSGTLEEADGSLESWDDISGSTANGYVTETSDSDTYAFDGEVTDFAFLEGEADVYVDGTQVDPSTLGGSSLEHTIELVGTGVTTNYEFTTSGTLEEAASSLESWDDISGSTANGYVTETSDSDTYAFDGEVTDFAFLEGEADVYVDGTQVDPSTLGSSDGSDGGSDDGSSLEHTIELVGTGVTTNYEFSVTGALQEADGSLEEWDSVDGSVASGYVTDTSDSDTYAFDGDVIGFQFVEGEADVYVDGTQVDPTTLGLPNHVVFDGTNTSGETRYDLAVTDVLENDPLLGPTESDDSVEGSSASGSVTGEVDGFRFSGDLSRLQVSGNVDLTFEDTDG